MSDKSLTEHTSDQLWSARAIRLTAFPAPGPLAIDDWWNGVIGEAPDAETTRPREGLIQKQTRTKHGQFTLIVQPNRVQWQLTPVESSDALLDHEPSLGSFATVLKAFRNYASGWFSQSTCPSLRRIAFGSTLFYSVPDQPAGMEFLKAFIPTVGIDPVGSTDFLYQINRPRSSESGIEGLTINRLSRWSVPQWQILQMPFPPSPGSLVQVASPESYAVEVEMDINTSVDYKGVFTRNQLPGLFGELVEMAIEIARDGDKP